MTPPPEPAGQLMVFESHSPTRARVLRGLLVAALLVVIFLVVDVWVGIFSNPLLKPDADRVLATALDHVDDSVRDVARIDPPAETSDVTQRPKRGDFLTRPQLRTAFVVAEDQRSVLDYQQHADSLDAAFITWFSVASKDGVITRLPSVAPAGTLFGKNKIALPVITNADAAGNWHTGELAALLNDETAAARLIEDLKRQVLAMNADGINVDFEQFTVTERDDFSFWIKRLSESFHRDDLLVTVDVPLYDEAYDYEYLGTVADAVVLMAYDEHYPGSPPGSIAGEGWFTDAVDEMSKRIPPAKLIVALGAYGYDWNLDTKAGATSLGFDDAMRLADNIDGTVETSAEEVNPRFLYQDEDGDAHEVWLLDAATAWNQTNIAARFGLRGISLWRMGLEDPGMWDFFGTRDITAFDPAHLCNVSSGSIISYTGDGELLHITSLATNGRRQIDLQDRMVDHAEYIEPPHFTDVTRYGHNARKRIALTFDDGPDPAWTPQLLDVLKANAVPATFFVIGEQARKHPEMVRRCFTEGHTLGSHSFMHPHIEQVSNTRLHMELNATQRAIQSATGRSTLLFRAPYDTDTKPTGSAVLRVIEKENRLGYINVGADIDSCDYEKPGVPEIVRHVLEGLAENGPNIVVMHDGGGDRQQTVEALRQLIPQIKARGYQFVGVPALMHSSTDAVMPLMTRQDRIIVLGQQVLSALQNKLWRVLYWIFVATTLVSVGRILFVGLLVWRHHRKQIVHPDFTPPVTVLVPAFNEAGVIARTLDAVLQSDYPDFTILVIDDGSTDRTADIVQDHARRFRQIRLITKANAGKWSALNDGFRIAETGHIVTIDADTLVARQTLRELMRPFSDETVDAVCGNVQVGNVRNILTAFQNVEYVTTQNYDRRAFSVLNCISVVPGATGAWKRASVLAAGGYSNQTLTEDADLTLSMLARGGRIVYAPAARSITEAPETHGALFKQRLRWSFGTFQCLWKHRRRFTAGTMEWVALANLFCFQLVWPLLAPLGDAEFIYSIWQGNINTGMVSFALFLLLDLIASVIAFRLDHRSPRSLWCILIQRFYYRQFMYIVAFAAVLRAIRGRRQGWNKLQRQGSVGSLHEAGQSMALEGAVPHATESTGT